jgi:alkylation response protein AidB-like acyl-CoA dehydrogenase
MASEIVERVLAVLPVIEAHRFEADRIGHMTPEVVAAAGAAGVFKLFAPVECGGTEAPLPEIFEVFELMGWADPTVAWHAGNSAAIGFVASFLSAEARATPFVSDGPFGLSLVPGGIAEVVEGGYELRGRWPFVTGCVDAPWAALSGVVHEAGEVRLRDGVPDVRMFLVGRETWTTELTWGTAVAMRGTGSNAVSIDCAFVEEVFAHSWFNPMTVDRPLFRVPTAVTGPPTNAAITTGIVRRAAEDVVALLTTKVFRGDGTALRDRVRLQQRVAAAQAEINVLSAGLQDMSAQVWTAAQTGKVPPPVRARMWSTAFWVLDRCRALISDLSIMGSSAFYADRNPVESALRDVHAIAAAMEPLRDLQEAAGRVALGLRAGVPAF